MNNFKELDFDISLIDDTYLNLINHTNNKFSIVEELIGYKKLFEDRTTEYYKTLRYRKMDPIIQIELEDDEAFKFEDMWDPYTGERIGKDPFGPLYFDPDSLIHYFYINRLKNLWTEPTDDNGGYYEGYYDMLVGSGNNIKIVGRGECPEKYLFRIPIIDCYLENDYNKSIITMGPKLTDNEIKLIDEIANKNTNNYKMLFKKQRPSLYEMKKCYDQAIDSDPYINIPKNASLETIKSLKYKANCCAVDKLKKM
jgi:hypothetical protein